MLAVEKSKATFLAPVGIGLSLFIAEIAGVYYTGGSLNPARSFGPCVANKSFPSEHWIYWVGPCLGAVVAAGFYWFIKAVEYQTANPGQDFDDLEANAFDPTSDLSRPVVSPNAVVDRSTTQDLAVLNSNSADQGRNSSLGSPDRARALGRSSSKTDETIDTRASTLMDRDKGVTEGARPDSKSGNRPNSRGPVYNSVTISSRKDEPPQL